MKVLSIYRYYWPDITPYARILRSILERLTADGHNVVVIAGQPAYNDVRHVKQPARESLGGVDVRRVGLLPERKWMGPLRTLNFLVFLARALCHALVHRYDVVLASSNPPVISGVALRLICWLTRANYVYHCQDLHPECAVLAKKLAPGRIEKWLTRVDTRNCRYAARTVVLSEDMVQTLRDRGLSTHNVAIINNFALDVPSPMMSEMPSPFGQPATAGLFRVLFAGNMGSFQGLDRIVDAAHLLSDETNIQFVFMGAGEQKSNLERQAAALVGRTVSFLPHQPVEKAFGCMHRAELGIVSLIRGVYKVAFPSKTMMYLAAGCPVLAVMEPQSVLANRLTQDRLGWVPSQMTPASIADAIRVARDEFITNGIDRQRIQRQCSDLFDRGKTIDKWAVLFDELNSGGRCSGRLAGASEHFQRRAA